MGLHWGHIVVLLGFYGVILGLCWGFMGIMEKKMKTTEIIGCIKLVLGFWVLGFVPESTARTSFVPRVLADL